LWEEALWRRMRPLADRPIIRRREYRWVKMGSPDVQVHRGRAHPIRRRRGMPWLRQGRGNGSRMGVERSYGCGCWRHRSAVGQQPV